ncbi:purine nucleosidase [Hasllibacter halocynthiae]|uniref:Purine nucleosidase n=1 Tax=Hasllibacter halocynthiae TaxID=595589 RepID=A0A2T0X7J5_9RHOB|nr:nucleoside hydrolase [Hasllibacter halocynthiae]PRY94918.1 purine nucleosidase [Hasllibacter halocynthiae]
MTPRPILIDTDPGQDDAVAILLALASPELDVRAITAVSGNVPVARTARNALQAVELSGRAVPVAMGCDRPMRRAPAHAAHVHGDTGLDGADLPEPTIPLDPRHGVDVIVETARAADGLTLVPLGPLTNVATALRRAPDIAGRLGRIVLMGGAYFEVGNITPAAEFNIWADPEAAAIVFRSGVPLTVVPLDCTHKALTLRHRIERFRAMPNRAGPVVAGWLDFFERFDRDKYGTDGGPLHDPLTIAWLLRPDLFTGREINVEIETESDLTRGMTVADWWGVTDRPPNALFLGDVDADAFYDLLAERIGRLP